jgi:hypothetical protein
MVRKVVQRRPGYEPALGRPDPLEVANPQIDPRSGTHVPGFDGPPCGLRPPPIDPDQYSSINPTCPECKKYKERAEAVTRNMVAGRRAKAGV